MDKPMEKTVRMFEAPNAFWKFVYQNVLGSISILCGIIAWILMVYWLELDALGGFGSRDSGVVREYFNYHPLMMMTGFVLLMLPAALSFEIFPFARNLNKNIHGLLNGLGLIASLAGFGIIIDVHKNVSQTGNFVSAHGCVGLITMICVMLNYIGGFLLYLLKLGGKLRIVFKPMHKRLGFVSVLLGIANCVVGIQEKCTKSELTGAPLDIAIAMSILLWISIIGLIFAVAKFMDKADGTVEYSPVNDSNSQGYGSRQPDDQL